MKTADWALVISLMSFVLSLAGFVWNIWSKFIYPKARVRVAIAAMVSIAGDGTPPRPFVRLSATNYGPTDITLHSHQGKKRRKFPWYRRPRTLGYMVPIEPAALAAIANIRPSTFPKKLAVGESAEVYFSADAPRRWIAEGDLYYFGFSDTFGRLHWCSRANAKRFHADALKDSPAVASAK